MIERELKHQTIDGADATGIRTGWRPSSHDATESSGNPRSTKQCK
jgi:hypothetical protein